MERSLRAQRDPEAALDKLVAALQSAVQAPAFRARLADLGAEPVPVSKATPASLGALLKAEVDKWGADHQEDRRICRLK